MTPDATQHIAALRSQVEALTKERDELLKDKNRLDAVLITRELLRAVIKRLEDIAEVLAYYGYFRWSEDITETADELTRSLGKSL